MRVDGDVDEFICRELYVRVIVLCCGGVSDVENGWLSLAQRCRGAMSVGRFLSLSSSLFSPNETSSPNIF